MGRRGEYLITAIYSVGWNENRDLLTSFPCYNTQAEAIQAAADEVGEMRSRGANSPLRLITVRWWKRDAKLRDAPVLFRASYYDAEQKLTDIETYAARVHDWHVLDDRSNRQHAAMNSQHRFVYPDWLSGWGPKPTTCPACDAVVDPQNMY